MIDNIFILTSIFSRILNLLIFIPILRMAYKEVVISDKIKKLRWVIFLMLSFYFISILTMLYTIYCTSYNCIAKDQLDFWRAFVGLGNLAMALAMYFVYRMKFEE